MSATGNTAAGDTQPTIVQEFLTMFAAKLDELGCTTIPWTTETGDVAMLTLIVGAEGGLPSVAVTLTVHDWVVGDNVEPDAWVCLRCLHRHEPPKPATCANCGEAMP